MHSTNNQRRWTVTANSLTSNVLFLNNPWVVVWWSMAFPGFGHLLVNHYIWGFILITFEYVVNNLAQLNTAIFYSMLGEIEKAKDTLEVKWMFIYIPVYISCAYDSYRRCVDNNKAFHLAYLEINKTKPFQFTTMELNLLEKKKPIIACFWSSVLPGLGEFTLHRLPLFIFAFFWWFVIIYFSNNYEAIYLSIMGEIQKSKSELNPQWAMFIPSIYLFSMFISYKLSVENNKVFEMELSRYLKTTYQNGDLDDLFE